MDKVGHHADHDQAGLYSATMHYLKAIDGHRPTDEAPKVMAQMRATPVNDSSPDARSAIDGRMVPNDLYLSR